MSDPDEFIAASPSELLAAAGVQRSAAAQLRAAAPTSLDAAVVGDPAAAEAVRGGLHAVVAMTQACAEGVDDLAGALVQAQSAYALADGLAVPGTPR